jgi:NADH-quinone oxidoreductase subunit G
MVNIKINDKPLSVEEGTTILHAARQLDIDIPTLCYTPLHLAHTYNIMASCRVCVVEVKGRRNLAPACTTACTEGMEIFTNTQRVIMARRTVIELLLSDHPLDCPTCPKNMNCKLQAIADKMGIREMPYKGEMSKKDQYTTSSFPIRRNSAKCILCGTCVMVCNKIQTCGVLHEFKRGFHTEVGPEFGLTLDQTNCVACGQCVNVCPTGALDSSSEVDQVWKVLGDKTKHVCVQVAPSVRAALGEEFGYNLGTPVTGKIPSALRIIGFEHVFDTNFGADLTIVEEATELVKRLRSGKNLPMITSCCPGWINFIEKNYPDMLNYPSSCKSPMSMQGAIIKTYYAQKMGWDPKDVVVVSIMPCTAKMDEMKRQQLVQEGKLPDDDYVLTTRDFAHMIREAGINFDTLEISRFDDPMGESTGGADIFGCSGGVMESAIRCAKYWLEGKVENVELPGLRGTDGIKKDTVTIAGKKLRLCVASGLGNARTILEEIKAGQDNYDFIEIMACPGGCVNGGGQPFQMSKLSLTVVKARQSALYNEDRDKLHRISAQNASIKKVYDDYLGEFGGEKAEDLLHTHLTDRQRKQF